jgi:hypothetical protein
MMTPRQPHPLLWLVESLSDHPSFANRAMFGGRAIHYGGRFVLYLTMQEEPWRGVLVPTERGHHPALVAEFPALAPHPVLGKWLYLPESSPGFEDDAHKLVRLVHALDQRIGIVPGAGKKRLGGKSRKPRHFMSE